jgi:hypothetical protein
VVHFDDCDLRSADLYRAKLTSSQFHNCQLSQVELSQADLEGAMFRTSDVEAVRGVSSLRGIIVDEEHAVVLAMAMLPALGITIERMTDD